MVRAVLLAVVWVSAMGLRFLPCPPIPSLKKRAKLHFSTIVVDTTTTRRSAFLTASLTWSAQRHREHRHSRMREGNLGRHFLFHLDASKITGPRPLTVHVIQMRRGAEVSQGI